MTYRGFCDRHRIILANYHHEFGRRNSLYEMTYKLLLEMPGLEVAAWPFIYPWSRYGDTDVRERLVEWGLWCCIISLFPEVLVLAENPVPYAIL